jgi:AraC-like DNA-binding protein
MIDQLDMIEIALRAAAAGVTLMMAGLILFSRAPLMRRLLGALFLWATTIYILISGAEETQVLGSLEDTLRIFAIFNSVFFWWFTLSLFDDDFRWTWWKVVPFVFICLLHPPFNVWESLNLTALEQVLHSSMTIILMGHALWVALHDRPDDLVNPRRRFRIYFAVAIGVTGIVIAVAENIHEFYSLPDGVKLLQAAALAALTFFFGSWLLSPNRALFAPDERPAADTASEKTAPRQSPPAPAADMPAYQRLMTLMEEGAYRKEGLTVAALAEQVGVPEHQLRRLINRELGFRNFSAFLNERRIADAKTMLAAPENAKKQILQIALDHGYGSIAPFNRAFKDATGKTPSEFRREALEQADQI